MRQIRLEEMIKECEKGRNKSDYSKRKWDEDTNKRREKESRNWSA